MGQSHLQAWYPRDRPTSCPPQHLRCPWAPPRSRSCSGPAVMRAEQAHSGIPAVRGLAIASSISQGGMSRRGLQNPISSRY